MTCGLAEDAVTETEQEAVVPPPPTRAQLEAGLNVSVAIEEVNATDPVGAVLAPAAVFVTDTVTVTGCPTTGVAVEEPTVVEVESVLAVRFATALEGWWTKSPPG
jgi:hypothetical protein